MKALMKRFLIRTTLLFFIFLVIGYVAYSQFLPQYFEITLPISLLFFFVVTNLVHAYLLRIAEKEMQKFNVRFMGLSFMKMFVYLIFGIVLALLNRDTAKIFLANFLLMYICFSILEIYEIIRVVKRKN